MGDEANAGTVSKIDRFLSYIQNPESTFSRFDQTLITRAMRLNVVIHQFHPDESKRVREYHLPGEKPRPFVEHTISPAAIAAGMNADVPLDAFGEEFKDMTLPIRSHALSASSIAEILCHDTVEDGNIDGLSGRALRIAMEGYFKSGITDPQELATIDETLVLIDAVTKYPEGEEPEGLQDAIRSHSLHDAMVAHVHKRTKGDPELISRQVVKIFTDRYKIFTTCFKNDDSGKPVVDSGSLKLAYKAFVGKGLDIEDNLRTPGVRPEKEERALMMASELRVHDIPTASRIVIWLGLRYRYGVSGDTVNWTPEDMKMIKTYIKLESENRHPSIEAYFAGTTLSLTSQANMIPVITDDEKRSMEDGTYNPALQYQFTIPDHDTLGKISSADQMSVRLSGGEDDGLYTARRIDNVAIYEQLEKYGRRIAYYEVRGSEPPYKIKAILRFTDNNKTVRELVEKDNKDDAQEIPESGFLREWKGTYKSFMDVMANFYPYKVDLTL